MPEYLAPGVYVEEVSFRAKTIEGVSTSTAGFVGPARYGPTSGEPELLTSFADFERVYGGLDPLDYGPNYLAHGVRAFFEEGGRRLYVARIEAGDGGFATANNQGIASPPPDRIDINARFRGRAGNMRVTFLPRLSDNLLINDPVTNQRTVRRVQPFDTVVVVGAGSPPSVTLYDVVRSGDDLALQQPGSAVEPFSSFDPASQEVRLLTVDVAIERPITRPKRPRERYTLPEVLEGFSFHPNHGNALTTYFDTAPTSRRLALVVPFAIEPAVGTLDTGAEMALALLGDDVIDAAVSLSSTAEQRQRVYRLEGGTDGGLPAAAAYQGVADATAKSGLAAFEDLEDISIVAAPGYSQGYANGNLVRVAQIQAYLISHCERMRYRIAVLDSPDDQTVGGVRAFRGQVDSTHGALYYPWVRVVDPVSEEEMILPPSGFVAGIYARNDVEKGVHKAPANEVVRMAVGFEFLLNKSQQDVLNPEGVNCFRFFEGRGYRLWGARTISSDPEWKYVNLRRYFAYLERSIEKGTQWVVFENNHEPLWANVRRTVEDFLFNEWKSGHLMGEKPQEAYFVRCDRSTMTQNDIDNGRLICLIGVAPVRPAEFVIFRIGQWTAERRG
ncbi:MAG TPA: phage tail sheath subtilisin-like domain-containing protein [Anaerolineae bacterium]|nr:phage tail sheath subtilisin-like domain-containing protein [Anaerolineae bacterium]HNU02657.1 phage tail sheath subtilisin-like domain-containing protein [Anaerolineae bacterium]